MTGEQRRAAEYGGPDSDCFPVERLPKISAHRM